METEFFELSGMDEAYVRQERNKAKELRKTGWWQRKIGAGLCYYCGGKFPPKELTMDHIVPLGRGGTSAKGNLVASCKECNSRKKNMLPVEWEEYMALLEKQRPLG